MAIVKRKDVTPETIAPGRTRYLAHTDRLMTVVFEFSGGPTTEPDPPHSHPHEQVSYVAEGEIMLFMGGEQVRLGPGDLFTVPGNRPHSIQLLTEKVRLIDAFTPLRKDFI